MDLIKLRLHREMASSSLPSALPSRGPKRRAPSKASSSTSHKGKSVIPRKRKTPVTYSKTVTQKTQKERISYDFSGQPIIFISSEEEEDFSYNHSTSSTKRTQGNSNGIYDNSRSRSSSTQQTAGFTHSPNNADEDTKLLIPCYSGTAMVQPVKMVQIGSSILQPISIKPASSSTTSHFKAAIDEVQDICEGLVPGHGKFLAQFVRDYHKQHTSGLTSS